MKPFAKFDAAMMPLDGLQLIEASAGTGKTFSLASLYVRLLLERDLEPRDILVMTFTRAATQELRERIRARLAQAARIASGRRSAHSATAGDEQAFAATLIERAAAQHGAARVAARLRTAAACMDEATITTIHGFAHRAAQESAFDSTLPFDRGDHVDDRQAYREAARDYWRAQIIERAPAEAAVVREIWSTPDELVGALAPLLLRPHVRLWDPQGAEFANHLARARHAWNDDRTALTALLQQCVADDGLMAGGALRAEIESAGNVDALIEGIDASLNGTHAGHVVVPAWICDLASPDRARTHLKQKCVAAGNAPWELPAVQALARIAGGTQVAALRHAWQSVRETAAERKRLRRQFSFADLIETLHAAIHDGARGNALASALHRRWPWALVDEFQDTDPYQYQILRRIYIDAGPVRDRSGGLVLIGDPKQAIYGFRGGDVFAYLQASSDAEARYSLGTNWRSTPEFLRAVAALFESAASAPFVIERIAFQRVAAGRPTATLRVHGQTVPPLTVWNTGQTEDKPSAQARVVNATVARIAQLLEPGAAAIARDDTERPVAAGDIAVLVNTNAEAALVQRTLSRHGIAAVCLHQHSVFATGEAKDILRALQAYATPSDEDALRAAMTTPLLGYRQRDLLALREDENALLRELDAAQLAHERWRRTGVLAMLEPLLQQAAPRLLTLEDGERRLTNYLQLVELLQQAEAETFGMAGLIAWLSAAVAAPPEENVDSAEAAQLRLESDAALVRIATIHRVKGLQFPIVFLPFAMFLGTGGDPAKPPYAYHDDADVAWLDLSGDTDHRARAVREARAEAVRLLYVALTRAEQACFMTWGPANTAANAALGWLLHQQDGAQADERYGNKADWLTPATVDERLRALHERAPDAIEIAPLPDAPVVAPAATSDDAGMPVTRPLPAPRAAWSVFSFTRLIHDAPPVEPRAGVDDELSLAAAFLPADEQESSPLDRLRGARFGSAIHELLETVAFEHWPGGNADEQIRRALHGHGFAINDDDSGVRLVYDIRDLVSRVITTPIPEIGALTELPHSQRRAEMAFTLRVDVASVGAVTALLGAAGYAAALAPEQTARVLRGLMRGFIDLVVQVDGRFYVIDYKTNHLGNRIADYRTPALDDAVRRGHYDLQYMIYSVALHRYLTRRLPGYAVERHFGGVRYLFVRGMNGRDATTGIYSHRPGPDVIREFDALLDTDAERVP
jgi:exodeoxyribonuclease V beta subunit